MTSCRRSQNQDATTKQMSPRAATAGTGGKVAGFCRSLASGQRPDTAPLSQAGFTGMASGSGLENKQSALIFLGGVPRWGVGGEHLRTQVCSSPRQSGAVSGGGWRQVGRATGRGSRGVCDNSSCQWAAREYTPPPRS